LPQQNGLQHTFHAEIAVVPLRNWFESQAAAAIHVSVKNLKKNFSWIKMDSRKYSMYMLFFSDSGKCFYSMYRFFLPIPGDVFEAEIIDFVFYVSHRD